MAGQRENDEVEREIAEAFKSVSRLRPSHRIVHMWRNLEACLESIRKVEWLLEYYNGFEREQLAVQLHDARSALGVIALALAEEAEA